MKQFWKVFSFEFNNHLKNKIIVGITAFLVLLMAVVLFFPRITVFFNTDEAEPTQTPSLTMLVKIADPSQAHLGDVISSMFEHYNVYITDDDINTVKEEIAADRADCAIVLSSADSFVYYVKNHSMDDINPEIVRTALQTDQQERAMIDNGIPAEQATAILNTQIIYEIETLSQDQSSNFLYTYIIVFALYLVIMLYGQMISTNVAIEKSSRAMELLITSTNPTSMMFGKVIASCLMGLVQLTIIFGSAVLFYSFNKEHWENNIIFSSIFNIPIELLIYMLVFFVFGFLIYAFLFGAIGSLASKLEDINVSTIPIMVLFIIAFIGVTTAVSSNDVNSSLMKVCSYIPFSSPMAMFARIAMSSVPIYEIVISIVILLISVVGIGFLSARIYRLGVLLYGNPPKIGTILKSLSAKR